MKKMVKVSVVLGSLFLMITGFKTQNSLKGVWEFHGGVYNGKKEGATVGYTLQRRYDSRHYEAFGIDSTNKPEKYEGGDYLLRGDTCIETETYNSQPSNLIGVPIHYFYTIRNDTLTLRATLPGGMAVEEYWLKKK